MVLFFIGLFIGVVFGFFAGAVLTASGEAQDTGGELGEKKK